MKTIKIYETDSGVRFDTVAECTDYEQLEWRVKVIMDALPERPDGCDFANGDGCVQHDRDALHTAKIELLESAKAYTDHKWIQQTIDDPEGCHISYALRILSDCSKATPIYYALRRFDSIDSRFREWGQPYYSNNPHEAESQRVLNGR
jgi:hypothetical protein